MGLKDTFGKSKKRGTGGIQRIVNFSNYIEIAGYKSSSKEIHKKIIIAAGVILACFIITLIGYYYAEYGSLLASIAASIGWIFFGIPTAYLGTWLTFYVATDFRIARRRESVEQALPDYLQLAASNIRAGMTIDQALWLAIRPRFGILATEMELVAKKTMSGEKIENALGELGKKYDSAILRRTISLIVEGMRAGSEIGALLENISIDITDMYQRRDNMAANVTQYLIFILFAVAVAAPLLFGMSIQLLTVLNTIGGDLVSSQTSSANIGFSISLSGESVNERDFFIFCIVSIISSSFFSGLIVSNIKNGNARDVLKLAPTIAVIALILFLVSSWGLSLLFADLI